jgi:hypothetical protein
LNDALLAHWAVAFSFTQIVEIPIYRRMLDARFFEAFGASAITHPLLWFVFVPLVRGHLSYAEYAAVGEILVVLVEAAYFGFVFKRKRALVASLSANAASFALGLLSNALFGWP